MTIELRVGSATDVGRARSANEDAYLRDDTGRVFAVADGMGGHRAGDVASATALETFEAKLGGGATLVDAITSANAEVFAKAQANPEMHGMGTTVTAVQLDLTDDDTVTALVGHVGDSRAYLLRDGELTQVTEDHSLVEELVREGRLTPEEAAVHPRRSIITRALGVEEWVDVATYEVDLRPGDRILVCSDGLTSMVRDGEITRILRAEADPQAAADRLVAAANKAGGEDNITVVVIDVVGDKGKSRSKALTASHGIEPTPDEATGEWERSGPSERKAQWERSDAPDTGDAEGDGAEEAPRPGPRGPRGPRLRRALLWIVPIVAVLGVAFAALGWYARSTYFVGLENHGEGAGKNDKGDRVVLYRGVPDGFLLWGPTVEERTALTADDLTDARYDDLTDGHRFSSRGSAEAFIARLEHSTTAATTTTTTVPAPTTAPA